MASEVEHEVVQNFELTLDELDDKEFGLPPVDKPPTLESILNERDEDNQSVMDEEGSISNSNLLCGDASDTVSMSSQEDILADQVRPRARSSKNTHYAQHGSILRHVILKGVSAQIQSASDRVDAGRPSALAVSSLIAVGTSHGLVLVFDPLQVLKCCLGSRQVGIEYGAVSALSFNRDCTRLLCGFARGQITMWDVPNGKLLRTITDAHPPGTAILHIKFTDDLTLAVCSDSGGSVFELEFKRLIGVRTCESRCLFSGSRGEVCAIEPLHISHSVQDHPMRDVIVLAMASLSKVLIVTLRPQLKVMFSHQLKGDSSTLPLLAWQFVVIQVSEKNRVVDPVLAFARDKIIYFYQVVCRGPDDIRFAPLQKTELPYKLLALSWLNARTMVAVDSSERAHIIDVRSEEELEVIDLSDVALIYSSSFYKSLATGGNVSKALAYAGESACYHSIVCHSGQLVLLGTKAMHVMTMRGWMERVDLLVKQDNYQAALALAVSFYEGKAKAIVGLSGSLKKRKQLVADKMLDLLCEFVTLSVTSHCPARGTAQELKSYYENVIPVCVEYCLILNRMDILFDKLYEDFGNDVVSRGVFLECLEPYMLSDRLTSVTPSVMKDFVSHYAEQELLTRVEACIVHLDIASLDIHQVVSLCWANGLYDAILYIYNRGMLDYTTPLEELLALLRQAVNTGKQLTESQIKLGNKLLVYVSCCLAGLAYPRGDIPQERQSKVKDDVFKVITALHTRDANEAEPAYPHLKSLLQFDTREFFNVLSLAFEEPEFNTEDGMGQRQRVVDILLQIMVESVGFSPSQVAVLFTFLARQMARHENIYVNRVLFDQVLECLANPCEHSRQEERQQALLELLVAGGLDQVNQTRLLNLAENAHFYQVCEFLYESRREFDRVLSCYLRDSPRRHQSFSFIESVLTSSSYSEEEKQAVEVHAMDNLKVLVEIDAANAARTVLVAFSNTLSEAIRRLRHDEQCLYEFLTAVFQYSSDENGSLAERHVPVVDEPIHELYIDLMCKQKPQEVHHYLSSTDGYRLEETLIIVRKYSLIEATSYLLEISGKAQEAFNVMHGELQTKMDLLISQLVNDTSNEPDINDLSGCILSLLIATIQLNQRNSAKMDEDGRQAVWFPLLETMMTAQKSAKDAPNKSQIVVLNEQTSQVLNGMMGYISLPAILQKIMQDPTYNTGKFGDIKELILGMLDTYNYEKTLLGTCTSLVKHDLFVHLSSLTKEVNRGILMNHSFCCLCQVQLNVGANTQQEAIGFRCGHAYHVECLMSTGSRFCVGGEETWICCLCNQSRRGRIPSQTRVRLPSSNALLATVQSPTSTCKKLQNEVVMSAEQIQSMESLRRVQKTQSRMAILQELSKPSTTSHRTSSWQSPSTSSILQNDLFQLRLAPPPIP